MSNRSRRRSLGGGDDDEDDDDDDDDDDDVVVMRLFDIVRAVSCDTRVTWVRIRTVVGPPIVHAFPPLPCGILSREGKAMVAEIYLEVAHGVVIITRYAAVADIDAEAEAEAAAIVVVVVEEEGSLNPLTGPKSAHRKGLGHAPVLISSTVSSKGTRI